MLELDSKDKIVCIRKPRDGRGYSKGYYCLYTELLKGKVND